MKLRVMGTTEELAAAEKYYRELEKDAENIKSVQISRLYPNRGSTTVSRLYVDIEYREHFLQNSKELTIKK